MITTFHVLWACAVCALTVITTKVFISVVHKRGWFAVPNARSSHKSLIPTSGGMPLLLTAVPAWLLLAWPLQTHELAFLGALAGIALVSFIDDRGSIDWRLRLVLQSLAVAICLIALPAEARLLPQYLPVWFERGAIGFAWLWFINLFNFMDGIDGLAGSEATLVCLGIVLIVHFGGVPGVPLLLALVIAAATLGFLIHNWAPARIFLGDVGSISLGFAIGWLLLQLALAGAWLPALILPLLFVADATITLLARIARGERFWEPHRQHAYQAPVRAGWPHASVAVRAVIVNLALIGCAALALSLPLPAAGLAAALVIGFLWYLQQMAARPIAAASPSKVRT